MLAGQPATVCCIFWNFMHYERLDMGVETLLDAHFTLLIR